MDNASKLKSSETTDATVNVIWTDSAFRIGFHLTSINCIQPHWRFFSLICMFKEFRFSFYLRIWRTEKVNQAHQKTKLWKAFIKCVSWLSVVLLICSYLLFLYIFFLYSFAIPLLVYTVSNPWWCNSWIIFTGFYILFLRKVKW